MICYRFPFPVLRFRVAFLLLQASDREVYQSESCLFHLCIQLCGGAKVHFHASNRVDRDCVCAVYGLGTDGRREVSEDSQLYCFALGEGIHHFTLEILQYRHYIAFTQCRMIGYSFCDFVLSDWLFPENACQKLLSRIATDRNQSLYFYVSYGHNGVILLLLLRSAVGTFAFCFSNNVVLCSIIA